MATLAIIKQYKQGDNYIEYSNDGSVYEEPKKIEIELTIEEQYQNLVVNLIRQKYSINDELAILRQHDEKPTEYQGILLIVKNVNPILNKN